METRAVPESTQWYLSGQAWFEQTFWNYVDLTSFQWRCNVKKQHKMLFSCMLIVCSLWYVWQHLNNTRLHVPLKASEEDEEEIEAATASLAAARETHSCCSSFIRTGPHFHIKRRTKSCADPFLGGKMFSFYSWLVLTWVEFNREAHSG